MVNCPVFFYFGFRCLPLHLDGHFRRRDSSSVEEPEALAFTEEMRAHMDRLVNIFVATLCLAFF